MPFHASPYVDLEEDLKANWRTPFHTLIANMAALLRAAGIEGHRVYRVGDAVHVESAPSLERPLDLSHPDLRHATVQHRTLHLMPEEAERLQGELNELLDRYGHGDRDDRRRPYLAWGALVPHVVRDP